MTTTEPTQPPPQRASSAAAPWAKARILETAATLFYDDSIRLVGVDRLIAEAGVTKATFYKHYRSKERLVQASLTARSARDKEFVNELVAANRAAAGTIQALADAIASELLQPGFRGCAYLNAASEYPDRENEVRKLITDHRDWYSQTVEALLFRAKHPLPAEGADEFMLARDGAMVGGYAGDPVGASQAFRRVVESILAKTAKP